MYFSHVEIIRTEKLNCLLNTVELLEHFKFTEDTFMLDLQKTEKQYANVCRELGNMKQIILQNNHKVSIILTIPSDHETKISLKQKGVWGVR